jgi:hypothetical protein
MVESLATRVGRPRRWQSVPCVAPAGAPRLGAPGESAANGGGAEGHSALGTAGRAFRRRSVAGPHGASPRAGLDAAAPRSTKKKREPMKKRSCVPCVSPRSRSRTRCNQGGYSAPAHGLLIPARCRTGLAAPVPAPSPFWPPLWHSSRTPFIRFTEVSRAQKQVNLLPSHGYRTKNTSSTHDCTELLSV